MQGLDKLKNGQDLSREEAATLLREMVKQPESAEARDALKLLAEKGEAASELLGFIDVARECQQPSPIPADVLDIVGTGGDGANTINISTAAAIVAAACGVKVAKHGNRSASSKCGSADVLEALGLNVVKASELASATLDELGICFLFTPVFHPAFKAFSSVRKELGIRTIFNLVGPLLHPSAARYFVLGVSHPELIDLYAKVIPELGMTRALVIHGAGLDEFTPVGECQILEIEGSKQEMERIDPRELGMPRCTVEELQGGVPRINAHQILRILEGYAGPQTNAVILNAALALYTYGAENNLEHAVARVKRVIKKGEAFDLYMSWVDYVKNH